ncbi:LPS assembly lipoprotein LptE [Cardinium endosymbiont of Culicoides punctatus]|uniref:LPS assembly lipoprotein LptE n=1 Tax=Cardinium endosymbiont of Culicoides punctatus TaxID=2304601 RepID=UPI001404DCFA|nr:LPS assembly lipoprotein LptE [Cardinium endosymbiont of Culicoides punctatus]
MLKSCGLFSFSGAALSSDIKTFSIGFYSEVSDGPMDMAKRFTEGLETKILRTTSLSKETTDGDLQYEGGIKSFSYTTTFSTKNDNKEDSQEVQRLTITIEVSYHNPSDEEASFKKKIFSSSADKVSDTETEDDLVNKIIQNLVDDICHKSIDNW